MNTRDPWTWLKELNFISVFFSWFFMLLSRLAEPCMSLAALYIIIEAGIPAVASTLFTNLSEGVLIAAPEIILPGAFVIAAQAKSQGNTKAWMLYSMCWLFVVLTGVTLASLFVIHLTGTALSVLMCARCTAGVGYSILIRVVTHSTEPVVSAPPIVPAVQIDQLATLTATVATLAESLSALRTEQATPVQVDVSVLMKMIDERLFIGQPDRTQASGEDTAIIVEADTNQAERTQASGEKRTEPEGADMSAFERTMDVDTAQLSSDDGQLATAERIAAYVALHPEENQKQIATALGLSERTVRRYRIGQKSEEADTGMEKADTKRPMLKVVR